jgi:hypothetical protein
MKFNSRKEVSEGKRNYIIRWRFNLPKFNLETLCNVETHVTFSSDLKRYPCHCRSLFCIYASKSSVRGFVEIGIVCAVSSRLVCRYSKICDIRYWIILKSLLSIGLS